jgi:hypothetical protein
MRFPALSLDSHAAGSAGRRAATGVVMGALGIAVVTVVIAVLKRWVDPSSVTGLYLFAILPGLARTASGRSSGRASPRGREHRHPGPRDRPPGARGFLPRRDGADRTGGPAARHSRLDRLPDHGRRAAMGVIAASTTAPGPSRPTRNRASRISPSSSPRRSPTPRRAPTWSPRARACSRPPTRLGVAWCAICTTVRSRGWSIR